MPCPSLPPTYRSYHDHNYQAYKVFGETFMNDSAVRCGTNISVAEVWLPVSIMQTNLRTLSFSQCSCVLCHLAGLKTHGRPTCFTFQP